MRKHDIGAIPIGENDRLDRHGDRPGHRLPLHRRRGSIPKTATARDVMTAGIIFCLDKQELDDAARVMETKKVRRLPVINGKKRMIGMLSLGDVYHTLPRPPVSEVDARGLSASSNRSADHDKQIVVPDLGRPQSATSNISAGSRHKSTLALRGLVRT